MAEAHAARFTKGRSPWPFNRRAYTRRLRILLRNHDRALERGVAGIITIFRAIGGSEELATDLEIVAREALANAMDHGNQKSADKWVRLRIYGCPGDSLLVVVSDEGAGFDPLRVPDPRSADRLELSHGRGLLLMRELLDHVEYRKGGREVVMFKTLASA